MTKQDFQRLEHIRDDVTQKREQMARAPAAKTADEIISAIFDGVEIIDTLTNKQTRDVKKAQKMLRRKYLQNRTWQQIADEFGYLDKTYAARYVRRVKSRCN